MAVPPQKNLKVLVIGSGGREHALVKACLASSIVARALVAPGNGGMAAEVNCLPLDVKDTSAIVALAKKQDVDLVIIGPEEPLAQGVVDALEAEGILAYGPNRKAARLEASKAFTKAFLQRYRIPTAAFQTFVDTESALAYVHKQSTPLVVKASGLAAGKGVIIAQTHDEAAEAVKAMLEKNCFGESGREVVIEEYLEGEEASIHLIVCGKDYLILPSSQDHKRIGENDTGPNTGGMGAYAPASVVTTALLQETIKTIIEPTLSGLITEGIDFRGTLYIGLMLTSEGPKVLEFNVRFGDPETQVLLPLLETDPISLMYGCACGKLTEQEIAFKKGSAVVVVLAAEGYPGNYEKGHTIALPPTLPEGVDIIHAGTALQPDGTPIVNGGRVLGVCAQAEQLTEALDRAHQTCESIHWPGRYYRKDIAAREMARSST